jgi:hypothetical protein
MADKTTEKQRGRPFEKGKSGNPKGRPEGSRNKATLAAQALIDGRGNALVEKALELALAGDGPVLKAMLDRLIPARKDSPIVLAGLPKIEGTADLVKASSAILEAVAKGTITPGEGQALAGLVEGHRRTVETVEMEARLTALEKQENSK